MKSSFKTVASGTKTQKEGVPQTYANRTANALSDDLVPLGNNCSDHGPSFWHTPHEPRVPLSNDMMLPEEMAFRKYLQKQLPTHKTPPDLLQRIKSITITKA